MIRHCVICELIDIVPLNSPIGHASGFYSRLFLWHDNLLPGTTLMTSTQYFSTPRQFILVLKLILHK